LGSSLELKHSIPFLSLVGGAYIPPARLKMMQESIEDKSRYVGILKK